ncbi:MAG TPA: TetR/AcrR family transcriptional regulator [Candidatus Limnocylindrales bacterium]|nr:TetR/AcrR family transcriptional regulator [Candidatus Limnocylindrales bacterium]
MEQPARSYVQRRRAESRAETRARILASARELIPPAGTSLPVTAIARHAGVAVQTIYDQFGSKGGLLIAVIGDVQDSFGLFKSFGRVFQSLDGEEAMRRMIAATVDFWGQAWPYLEFLLRARRVDPVVTREMEFIDRLRHAHYWAIAKRIEDEGRVRDGRSADWAADQAFSLTIPNVYEELAVRRSWTTAEVTEAVTAAVLGILMEPGTEPVRSPAPDWQALEQAAAERARGMGADYARLSPEWSAARSDAAVERVDH